MPIVPPLLVFHICVNMRDKQSCPLHRTPIRKKHGTQNRLPSIRMTAKEKNARDR
jgi:hypothetical protein